MDLTPVVERMRLVDPSGRPAEQVIEHRADPLTGAVASVNAALGEKARAFLGTTDPEVLRDLEERSRAGCPFCGASEKGTRFPPEIAPEGQLRLGASLAMPNLFSKAALDAVVIVDPGQHVLSPSRLAAGSLGTAVRLAAELVRRARGRDPSLVHHAAGMNFLQPGGSSVPHPHFQVHVRGVPYSGLGRLLERSAEWKRRTGRSYWEALLEEERRTGARALGRTGAVEWLAAWAPVGQKEVWGVLPGTASLAALGDADAESFGAGISKVVSFYEEMGNHPFTFAFLSSPEADRSDHFALQVRICARPALRPLYASYDSWFAPKLLGDDAHTEAPESYAARLRARW